MNGPAISKRPLWVGLTLVIGSVLGQGGVQALLAQQSTPMMARIPTVILSLLGSIVTVAQLVGVVLMAVFLYFALARGTEPPNP